MGNMFLNPTMPSSSSESNTIRRFVRFFLHIASFTGRLLLKNIDDEIDARIGKFLLRRGKKHRVEGVPLNDTVQQRATFLRRVLCRKFSACLRAGDVNRHVLRKAGVGAHGIINAAADGHQAVNFRNGRAD